jgi:chemotaxis protein MotA
LLALSAILIGAMLKGAGLMALVSTAGFMVVVVGTIGAICVQTPLPIMRHALKILPWVMRPPVLQPEMLLKKMLDWSNIVRRQGLLALEPALRRERDPFVRKALQLVVDGNEPDAIRGAMEVELSTREHTDTLGARVFEGMGVYSPTLGIIGAVLGLMAVLQNLADPSKLGHGIAAAFVATIYGIAFANLLFLPMGNKLKSVIHARTQVRTMVIEGIIAIAQGENPRNIEAKLQGYFHQ